MVATWRGATLWVRNACEIFAKFLRNICKIFADAAGQIPGANFSGKGGRIPGRETAEGGTNPWCH